MNGSDPGVIRQLTEIVIATRQPRNDPVHPCNIHTRPSRAISLGLFIFLFLQYDLLFQTKSVNLSSTIYLFLYIYLYIRLSNSNETQTEPRKYYAYSLHIQNETIQSLNFTNAQAIVRK